MEKDIERFKLENIEKIELLFKDCNSERKDIVRSKLVLVKGVGDIKGEICGLGEQVEVVGLRSEKWRHEFALPEGDPQTHSPLHISFH